MCLSCFLRISGIQRIAVVEKRRSYFDKQAKENLRQASGGDRRSEEFKKVQGLKNSSKVENKIDVRAKLAKLAGVSEKLPNISVVNCSSGSAKKVGARIKELERLYGIHRGNNQHNRVPNNSEGSPKSQEDIATLMGISVDTLNNYKKLTEMIPELEDLVDTGIVTKTSLTRNVGLVSFYLITFDEKRRAI